MVRTMRGSCPIRPAIEAMLMTRPHFAGIIDFLPRIWVSTNAAVRLRDRKSTRLNSSHGYISYAVFCLKKKKHQQDQWSLSSVSVRWDIHVSHTLHLSQRVR